MSEQNSAKDIERFKFKYETKGCRISLDDMPLVFITRRLEEHLKIGNKNGKFYKRLKEVGKEELFYPELTNNIIKSIEVNFVKIRKQKEIQTEKLIEADTSIKTWNDLKKVLNKNLYKREEEYKFVMACIISQWFTENDYIFILLIARRGEGKSTLLNPFDGSDLILSIDQCTTNAFAPGTAEVGEVKASLLEQAKGKTLIIHDFTALLSLAKDQRIKIFGDITNSYGKEGLKKFSPGAGNKRYGGGYNLIGGITYDIFKPNKKLLTQTGRFLYYRLPELDFMKLAKSNKVPNSSELQKAVQGYLFNLKIRFDKDKPKIVISDDVKRKMWKFFRIYEHYLKVYKYKYTPKDSFDTKYKLRYNKDVHIENPNRRYRQALMLLKAVAFIEGKTEVSEKDFDTIKVLFQGIDDPKTIHKKLELIPNNILGGIGNKFEIFESKEDIPNDEEGEPEQEPDEEGEWVF